MSSRQNVLDSMLARGEKPFTTRNAASHPAEQCRDRTAAYAEDRDESGYRRPLRQTRAPEELAQLIHLRSPVVEVELEVAVEVQLERERPEPMASRACSSAKTGTSPSPRYFHATRTRSAGTIATAHASPSRHLRATT